MEQEHRISYKAGITRTPSDFLCSDGELAECINLTTDNEELKPIVQPVRSMTYGTQTGNQSNKVLYIHKLNDSKRYIIAVCDNPGSASWYLKWTTDGSSIHDLLDSDGNLIGYPDSKIQITSIGKTLIVAGASRQLTYFLWKEDYYKNLGIIPYQDVRFYLHDDNASDYAVVNSGSADGIDYEQSYVATADREQWNDLVLGLYAKNKRAVANKKGFCLPFMVRTALRLFDDSYIYVSQPVMLFPSINRNTYMDEQIKNGVMQLWTHYKKLRYENRSYTVVGGDRIPIYEEWTDIVKDIVLFISDGAEINDLTVDQPFGPFNFHETPSVDIDGIFTDPGHDMEYQTYSKTGWSALASIPQQDIESDLTSDGVFYKLCSIGLFDFVESSVDGKIGKHQLENLTTQERLGYDDYFSRSPMIPQSIFAYNSRLNMANVSRGMFEGFGYFLPFRIVAGGAFDQPGIDPAYDENVRFYTTIQTEEGDRIVCHQDTSRYVQGLFFYYPDSRAKHVDIFRHHTASDKYHRILSEDLKEHEGLNGAYYFRMPYSWYKENYNTTAVEPIERKEPENLSNYIITSEVNNPWVFKAEGYNKVGTGKIIGMSTITQALSQGQFGQFPLLVFSESGIWAMGVNGTGLFQSIHPMSRDVCINPSSITQTDGAVFFVSKKGLMVVVGNEVKCVSGAMNGKTFNTASLSPLATGTDWAGIVSACQGERTFLDYVRDTKCVLAYDYVDSRILLINPDFGFAFSFNIADGTISKVILPIPVTNTVNDYPDYLLQGVEGIRRVLYSLYEKPREEEVSGRQTAFLLTRPMKLAGPVSQASLRQLMNVGDWNEAGGSMVKTEIYLSSDMRTWYNDISRFGAAARYYRLALYIKMLPTERLSGTLLTSQERRNNNIR